MKTKTIVRIEEDDPKTRKLVISEQLPIGDSLVGMRDGGSGDSIRRVDSEGHSVAVDQTREVISELLEGPTVQNEEGTRYLSNPDGEIKHVRRQLGSTRMPCERT